MRIYAISIISMITILMTGLISDIYAVCDVSSSTIDASSYLRECAGTPANAIDPSVWWGGVTAIKSLVISISQKVIGFGALFAIGAIVWSGIQYTTSYGEDEKIKKAKTTGIYAVIGLLLLLTAFSLVDIMVNFVYSLGA